MKKGEKAIYEYAAFGGEFEGDDVNHADTLAEALEYDHSHGIELVKSIGSEDAGITDKTYADIGAVKFEDGSKVPKRFTNEAAGLMPEQLDKLRRV